MSTAEAQPINLDETRPSWLRRLNRERVTQPRPEIPALNRAIEIVRARINPELARRLHAVAERVGFGRRQEAVTIEDVPSLSAEAKSRALETKFNAIADSTYRRIVVKVKEVRLEQRLTKMAKSGKIDPTIAKDLHLITVSVSKALKEADPVIQGYRNMLRDVAEAWIDRFDRPILEFMFGDEVAQLRELATVEGVDREQALAARAALQELYTAALQALQESGAVSPGEDMKLELLRSAALMSLLDIAVYRLEQIQDLSDDQIARYTTVLEYVATNQDFAALQGLAQAPTLLDRESTGFLSQMLELEATMLEARGIAPEQKRRPVRRQVPRTGSPRQANHSAPSAPRPPSPSRPPEGEPDSDKDPELAENQRRILATNDAILPFIPVRHEPLSQREAPPSLSPTEAKSRLDQEVQVSTQALAALGCVYEMPDEDEGYRDITDAIRLQKQIINRMRGGSPRDADPDLLAALNEYIAAFQTRNDLLTGVLVFRWNPGIPVPAGWFKFPIVRTYFARDTDAVGTIYTTQESDILYVLMHRSVLVRPRLLKFQEKAAGAVLSLNPGQVAGAFFDMLLYRSPSARAARLRELNLGFNFKTPAALLEDVSGMVAHEEATGIALNALFAGLIFARAHYLKYDLFGWGAEEVFYSYMLNRLGSTLTGGATHHAIWDKPTSFTYNTANFACVDGNSALMVRHCDGRYLTYAGVDAAGRVRSTGRELITRGGFNQDKAYTAPEPGTDLIHRVDLFFANLLSGGPGKSFVSEQLLGRYKFKVMPVGAFDTIGERPVYKGWLKYLAEVAAEPLRGKSLRNLAIGLVLHGLLGVSRIQRMLTLTPGEARGIREIIRIMAFRPVLAGGFLLRSLLAISRGIRGNSFDYDLMERLQKTWEGLQQSIATGLADLLPQYIEHGQLMGFETPTTVHDLVEQAIQETTGVTGIDQINVVLEKGFGAARAYFWYDPNTHQCTYTAAQDILEYSTQGCTYVPDAFQKAIELINAAQGR
ncbi:MAG: hypothetical protein PHS44_06230 [Candidatus Dojkabacteria bacterium]|nr:hypothetical protein [Candidatus Dojkabacteria bacterium]